MTQSVHAARVLGVSLNDSHLFVQGVVVAVVPALAPLTLLDAHNGQDGYISDGAIGGGDGAKGTWTRTG